MDRDKIDRQAVSVTKLDDQPSDAEYWRSRSPLERLATVEELRREYHEWPEETDDEDLPRLQRICRVRQLS